MRNEIVAGGGGEGGVSLSEANSWSADQTYDDGIKLLLGTDGDGILVHDAAGRAANAPFAGVLVGTPVYARAIPANSTLYSNITADGDFVFFTNVGGNSIEAMRINTSGRSVIFPSFSDRITPTVAFGDGDTGFYEGGDDILVVSIGTADKFLWLGNLLRGNDGASAAIINEAATATNPTLVPVHSDLDTGIGRAGTDQLSLIAGGVEGIRITEISSAISLINLKGPARVAGDIDVGSSNAFHYGLPTTDGTWKTVRDGTKLSFQRRETGAYVEKGFFDASFHTEKLLVEGAVDGIYTGLVITNSQAAVTDSLNESAELKFGFGSNNDVARITADKLGDYTTGPNEKSRLGFWVDVAGTLTEIAHIMPDGLMLLLGDSRIRFAGTAGGGGQSIQYKDSASSNRAALLFPGSDLVVLCNRAVDGVVEIRANTATGGAVGEVIAAVFEDDQIVFRTDDIDALTISATQVITLAVGLGVTEGGTGAGTFTKHGVMIGNDADTLVVTTPGNLGEVITSNGPSADPTFQVAGHTPERRSISTSWEASARLQQAVLQAGTIAFGTFGVTVSSGGTQAGSAKVRFTGQSTQLHRIDNSLNPAVYIEVSIIAAGTDAQAYWGFQDLVMDGISITFTGRHTGIKVIRASSSDVVSATNSDGTTEQATTFTWATDDIHGRFYIKKTTVNATYYLDGVLKVTETDNLDVGNNTNGISMMGNNANVATTVSWSSSNAMLSEDAGP